MPQSRRSGLPVALRLCYTIPMLLSRNRYYFYFYCIPAMAAEGPGST